MATGPWIASAGGIPAVVAFFRAVVTPDLEQRLARLAVGGADRDADCTLGRSLSMLPSDTFAHPRSQDLAPLGDPARRENEAGLIKRQTDRGPEVAPFLLDMLANVCNRRARAAKQSGAAVERDTLYAIRQALDNIGPEIAAGRPRWGRSSPHNPSLKKR